MSQKQRKKSAKAVIIIITCKYNLAVLAN